MTNIVYVNSTYKVDIIADGAHTGCKNMTFNDNTYWSIDQGSQITFPDSLSITQWQAEGKDVQVALKDPMFEDAGNFDFTLKDGSPALELGFKQIDVDDVGPRHDY